jgi:hypothetical protein
MSSPRNHNIWWAILAFALLILLMTLMDGCAKPRPSLLTETKRGDALVQREIEKTGSRRDVPVNKKPREVMAQSRFDHRGGVALISITKSWWPWADVQISMNCLICHKTDPIPFTRPKDPWWKWPALILGVLGMIMVLHFLDNFKSIMFFWRR